MPFTDLDYFEVIEKNEIVKKAFENIKQICIDLQKQTNCPEEDLKDFLEFISKQWNKWWWTSLLRILDLKSQFSFLIESELI